MWSSSGGARVRPGGRTPRPRRPPHAPSPSRRRPSRSRSGGRRCGPRCPRRCAGRCGPPPAKPPSGSCQGSPTGRTSSRTRPSSSARAATWAETRGSIQGSPARTYSGWAVSRARRVKPAVAVIERSRSREGQGRSGLTWSGVSGETPPQSSTPAPSRALHSSRSTRLGGAWRRTLGPSTIRETAIAATYSSSPRSSVWRIAVSGLARKFWMMTSWTWPYWRAIRRSSKIDSARSVRFSPMPISRPVVNGTESRPASSSTRTRTAGSLSGEP